MKSKKVLAMGLAGVMAFGMVGCSTPGSETTAAAGDSTTAAATAETTAAAGDSTTAAVTENTSGLKVFRYATATDPTSLDSCKGNSVADNEVNHLIQEGLVRNNCGEIAPGLAESWEVSEDGLTYTFHLRDAKWSDGQAITSQDFLYAFQRLADPATAAPYAWILNGRVKNGGDVIGGKKPVSELGVSAPDDKTFVVELEYAQGYFLSLLGSVCEFTPQRQDIVEKYGTDYAASADKMMTYGPFTLTSSANRQYVFEKNQDYWDADSINFDRIEMSVIETGDTQLAMYESGELDYVAVPTAQVPNYDDQDNEYMTGALDWVYINSQAEYVSNANFRLALNYAIDRETYNMLANSGTYTAWGNPVMPAVDGINATYGEEFQPDGYPINGDLTKAQEYLQKAMTEMGISDPSEITVEFTTTDAETNKKIAEVLQEMWQNNLGINVEIRQVTYAEIYGNVFPQHDYMVGYGGWAPDYADPYTYLELFMSDNVYNYSQYSNTAFDDLMKQSTTITDAKTRLETLAQAEQTLLDDGAVVPLQVRTTHYLMDDDVTGVGFYFIGYNIDLVYGDCAPTA